MLSIAVDCAFSLPSSRFHRQSTSMNTLVIDIGGSNVKLCGTGFSEKLKFESGPELTPKKFAQIVREQIGDWQYDRVSIG